MDNLSGQLTCLKDLCRCDSCALSFRKEFFTSSLLRALIAFIFARGGGANQTLHGTSWFNGY